MSQRHALSDDQVAGELRKMTAFIRQEAIEKAREIQLKADEEFAIEKSKLVREETTDIDTQYTKKFKQAAMSQQIVRSTLANKTRIRVLTGRQTLLNDLFDQARDRLTSDGITDSEGYVEVLKGLILEALYALNESETTLRARTKDYDAVRQAIEQSQAAFEENVGSPVQVKLNEDAPVSDESAGGIILTGGGGRIEINNTFEERLRLLETSALPSIRETLFGKNPNRQFYD